MKEKISIKKGKNYVSNSIIDLINDVTMEVVQKNENRDEKSDLAK